MITTTLLIVAAIINAISNIAILLFITWGGIRYWESGISKSQGTQTVTLALILLVLQIFISTAFIILVI
jgi:hypothetical protein